MRKKQQHSVNEVVPLDNIKKKADNILNDKDFMFKMLHPEEQEQEAFLSSLLQWFKNDFFSWVNTPSCSFCGVCK